MAKKTPEGKVKADIVSVLESRGAYYFFPVTGGFGRSGIPDIVACYRGKFIGIECKAGSNKPTALQLRELGKITDSQGCALVAYTPDVVSELLDNIDRL